MLTAPGSAKVAPDVARKPPTRPTRRPGRSAIDIAIKPERIGTIRLNATPPSVLNHAAAGVTVPNVLPASCALTPHAISMRNAIAMKIPPATTNGSICDTPFIR